MALHRGMTESLLRLGESHPLHEHGLQRFELIQHGRVQEGSQAPPIPAPHRLQSNSSFSGCMAMRLFMWGTQPSSCLPLLFPLHVACRGLAIFTARLWISALPQGWLQEHKHPDGNELGNTEHP